MAFPIQLLHSKNSSHPSQQGFGSPSHRQTRKEAATSIPFADKASEAIICDEEKWDWPNAITNTKRQKFSTLLSYGKNDQELGIFEKLRARIVTG